MFRFDRFEELRVAKGVSKKFIADAIGRTSQIIQDWKNPNKTVEPNDNQLSIVAKILDTTPEYLRGEVDEYGLTDTDWSTMGALFKDLRLSLGFSRMLAVDGEVITEAQLTEFEENGASLTPTQLTTICGLAGLDPTVIFAPWLDRLWGQKEKPPVIDVELADELELLRSRPEIRTLLHASRNMTTAQVEQMAQFMLTLKGGQDGKTD